MSEEYRGYDVVNTLKPIGLAGELEKRASKVRFVEFNGLGTEISVKFVPAGRNPRLAGIFVDPGQPLDGKFLVEVHDGQTVEIVVPRENLLIGRI